MSSYVKLTKRQGAPMEEIKAGELNQPVRVPELKERKCLECGQKLPHSYRTPTDEPWTSGIFACAEDPESCKMGLFCPCVLYGKNVETLNGTPWHQACTCHAVCLGTGITVLASLAFCHGIMDADTIFMLSEGLFFGSNIFAIYTSSVREKLQQKFHLKNSPCDSSCMHLFMHSCALCQEHREMKNRIIDETGNPNTVTNPPSVQEMSTSVNNQPSSSN